MLKLLTVNKDSDNMNFILDDGNLGKVSINKETASILLDFVKIEGLDKSPDNSLVFDESLIVDTSVVSNISISENTVNNYTNQNLLEELYNSSSDNEDDEYNNLEDEFDNESEDEYLSEEESEYDEGDFEDEIVEEDDEISDDNEYSEDTEDTEFEEEIIEDDDEYSDDEYINSDEDTQIERLYAKLNPEQILLTQRYFMWYSQRIFSKAQKENNAEYKLTLDIKNVKMREEKKALLEKMRSGSSWLYAGVIIHRNAGDAYCEFGHKLKNAHIAWKFEKSENELLEELVWWNHITSYNRKYNSIKELVQNHREKGDCLIFGSKCRDDFFEIPKSGSDLITRGQKAVIDDMIYMNAIMESPLYQKAFDSFKLMDSFIDDFDVADVMRSVMGEDRIFKYDELVQFYKEFRGLDGNSTPMLPPKTLIQEIRNCLVGWENSVFKGGTSPITLDSKVFTYLGYIIPDNYDKFYDKLRAYEYSRNFSIFERIMMWYLDTMFKYKICGVYEYNGITNAEFKRELEVGNFIFANADEGGWGENKVRRFREYYKKYDGVFSDLEYTKDYFLKFVDAFTRLPDNGINTNFDIINCTEEYNYNEGLYYCYETHLKKPSWKIRDKIREYIVTPEEKLIFDFMIDELNSYSFRGLTVEDVVRILNTDNSAKLKEWVDRYYNEIKSEIDKSVEEKNAKILKERAEKEKEKAEREAAKAEERRKYEEERLKEEKEERLLKEQQEAEYKQKIEEITSKYTFSSVSDILNYLKEANIPKESNIDSLDLRLSILDTCLKYDKPEEKISDRQWWHIGALFKAVSGVSIPENIKVGSSNVKATVPADDMEKLKWLVENRGAIQTDETKHTLDVITTVSKTGVASEKQRKHVDAAVELYKKFNPQV